MFPSLHRLKKRGTLRVLYSISYSSQPTLSDNHNKIVMYFVLGSVEYKVTHRLPLSCLPYPPICLLLHPILSLPFVTCSTPETPISGLSTQRRLAVPCDPTPTAMRGLPCDTGNIGRLGPAVGRGCFGVGKYRFLIGSQVIPGRLPRGDGSDMLMRWVRVTECDEGSFKKALCHST